MSVIEFRGSDHTYWRSGRQVPGITSILADLGAYPDRGRYTENSRQRGIAVHLACQLVDQHAPDAESLTEALAVLDIAEPVHPFLAGYLLFRREKRYKAQRWEVPLMWSKMSVCGTPDSWGRSPTGLTSVDLKSWAVQGAAPKHSAELQTACYGEMIAEHLQLNVPPAKAITRWVVKLPGDGSYRCYQCDSEDDYSEAAMAVSLWWKWKHKGIFRFKGDPEELAVVAA